MQGRIFQMLPKILVQDPQFGHVGPPRGHPFCSTWVVLRAVPKRAGTLKTHASVLQLSRKHFDAAVLCNAYYMRQPCTKATPCETVKISKTLDTSMKNRRCERLSAKTNKHSRGKEKHFGQQVLAPLGAWKTTLGGFGRAALQLKKEIRCTQE